MHAIPRAMLAIAILASPAWASAQLATEFRVTTGATFDSLPAVGRDAGGAYVVYTSRAQVATGYGPGFLWYQRLDASGAPWGLPVAVSTGGTDDQLNDACGNHVVYTAYDSQTVLSGRILVYDIDTASTTVLATATALREPRCFADRVVWMHGTTSAAMVLLYDLADLGTGASAQEIAGPSPSATNPEIGDRFVVWDSFVNNQRDVFAYDLLTGATFAVANDPTTDEWLASTSGAWIVWETRIPGQSATRIEALNADTLERRVIVDNSAASIAPTIDGNVVAYESRAAGNFDIYAYRLAERDTVAVTGGDATDQRLNNVLGDLVAYVDARNGSMDVYVSKLDFTHADPCAWRGGDQDGDGVCTDDDNCFSRANADQADADADGRGDACDRCPTAWDPMQGDFDHDGFGDACDNCPSLANLSQSDADADGKGNICDSCPLDAADDADQDGACANADNCPLSFNPEQSNADNDARGDACDVCPLDPYDDPDRNAVCGGNPFSVSPVSLSLGDVAVGGAALGRITISNLVQAHLSLTSVSWAPGSDAAFTMAAPVAVPLDLPPFPDGAIDLEVRFAPTVAGPVSASLLVTLLDPAHPPSATVTIDLAGSGVLVETPATVVQDLITAFDSAVTAGSLAGSGSGSSATGRLKALRNMIEAAGDLVNAGEYSTSCRQLLDAVRKLDGAPVPPDFASGPAAAEVRARLEQLRALLGCS